MTLGEVVAALTVGVAWTALLVGLVRPTDDPDRLRGRPTTAQHT